jgi:hypothetical protein
MVPLTPKIKALVAQASACFAAWSVLVADEPASPEAFRSPSEERALRRAAALVGNSEAANLTLVRELQLWRRRALDAESRMQSASGQTNGAPAQESGAKDPLNRHRFEVVSVLAAERVLVLSSGRDSGIYEGALVRFESGAVAKVIEARRGCCAAVLESSFRGNISALEGQRGQVMVR